MNELVAGWSRELEPLSEELAALLDDWLPRLRAAFGPARRPQDADPDGEPDGYSGLAGRGPWERLLTSEWALAREVPDEFVRRAAMSEQLFLRLERVLPAASPHTRVWVDCGPTQLGAPRLAHLAVLLVLRRRAEDGGGTLSWAPAHDPDAWRDGLDVEDVLGCRTFEPPATLPRPRGDVFTLGGPGLPGGRAHVRVSEGDGGLAVRVGSTDVRLELPDAGAVARLIARPVAGVRPAIVPSSTGAPVSALRFAPGGGALVGRTGERVVAWAVPRTPRPRPKSRWADPWFPGVADPLLAVGWSRRSLAVLRASDDGITLSLKGRSYRMTRPAGLAVPGADRLHWLSVLPGRWLHTGRERVQVLVRDGRDVLWALDLLAGTGSPLGRAACDPIQHDGVLAWLRPNGVWARLVPGTRGEEPVPDHGLQEQPFFEEVIGRTTDARTWMWPGLAVEVGGRWWVGRAPVRGTPDARRGTDLGPADRVLGAVAEGSSSLVWQDGHRVRTRRSDDDAGVLTMDASDDPVVAGAVGGRDVALMALGTASGQIVVAKVADGTPWLTFVPAEHP